MRKFHIETIRSVIAILEPGDFRAILKLKDVYFHPSFLPYRRFPYSAFRRKYQAFSIYCPALCKILSPSTFTKMAVVVVVAALRTRGLTIVLYLNDWLIKAALEEVLLNHLALFPISLAARLDYILGKILHSPGNFSKAPRVHHKLPEDIPDLTSSK